MCIHISGLDAVNGAGERSKTSVDTTLPQPDVGVKGSSGASLLQTTNHRSNQSGSLPPQHSSKRTDESTALDKELKDIAHKATMKALKRKLDEAEKVEKKARVTLAETQSTRKALRGRIQELNKQEAQHRTATFEAHKSHDELKQRIAQQERVRSLVFLLPTSADLLIKHSIVRQWSHKQSSQVSLVLLKPCCQRPLQLGSHSIRL